jgi:hypothetical protein
MPAVMTSTVLIVHSQHCWREDCWGLCVFNTGEDANIQRSKHRSKHTHTHRHKEGERGNGITWQDREHIQLVCRRTNDCIDIQYNARNGVKGGRR